MGRLPCALRQAILFLAIAALPPPYATAQKNVLRDAGVTIAGDRVLTRTQITPDPYFRGDTIRIRVVLYNLTDATLPIEGPPCGLDLAHGLETRLIHPELEARLALPERGCAAPSTRLQPVDSIAVTAHAIVLSPPGWYVLRVEPPRPASGQRASSFGTGVEVARPGAQEPRPAAPSEPARTIRYAVHVRDPENQPMTERDVDHVVQEAIRVAGGLGLPMSLEAARRAPPYLLVEIEDARRSVHWVCGEDSDPLLTFLGEGDPTPPDSRFSPFVEGGGLALMVEPMVERAVAGERSTCP